MVEASPAGGTSHDAPGSSAIDQMATSASGLAAHELGGGASGCSPSSAPAITVIVTVRPLASRWTARGMSWSQNIVKYGATSLSRPGRFSQI